jgi:hypothetical protein
MAREIQRDVILKKRKFQEDVKESTWLSASTCLPSLRRIILEDCEIDAGLLHGLLNALPNVTELHVDEESSYYEDNEIMDILEFSPSLILTSRFEMFQRFDDLVSLLERLATLVRRGQVTDILLNICSLEELDDDRLALATAAFSVIAPVVSTVEMLADGHEPEAVQSVIKMLTSMPRCKAFEVSAQFLNDTTTYNWENIWRFLPGMSRRCIQKIDGPFGGFYSFE